MKKLKSTLVNMVAVLGSISIIAAGLLAYVNKETVEPIKNINAKNLNDGIKAVVGSTTAKLQKTDTLKTGEIVYSTDNGTAVAATTGGFGGDLVVLVGFDPQGNIKGYQIMASQETPGLGMKASFWFQKGQKGDIIGKNPGKAELKVKKDGGDVDAITASTITSRAFLKAVNQAYKAYQGGHSDANSGASMQVNTNVKK
jgi:electron transport complex protein RnfG